MKHTLALLKAVLLAPPAVLNAADAQKSSGKSKPTIIFIFIG